MSSPATTNSTNVRNSSENRAKTEVLRALALAFAGFALLMLALPEWARGGVIFFAVLYAVLVVLVDDEVRALFSRKARAKLPGARRAAL